MKGGLCLNNVILVGRLTQNPEVIEIENNRKVTSVILAVNRNFKNSDGIYETDFIRCILWNGVAFLSTNKKQEISNGGKDNIDIEEG